MTAPDCLSYASEIERRRAPKDWPEALKGVPEECQDACREYLRGIAARIRVVRGLRHAPSDSRSVD